MTKTQQTTESPTRQAIADGILGWLEGTCGGGALINAEIYAELAKAGFSRKDVRQALDTLADDGVIEIDGLPNGLHVELVNGYGK